MPDPSSYEYETVAASQTDQVMGTTGAAKDYLDRLICTVGTSASSNVSIKDGAAGAAIPILAVNTPIGVYTVPVGLKAVTAANGGWRITTGAGVTVVAVGRFA
jgi:hypothetical protein